LSFYEIHNESFEFFNKSLENVPGDVDASNLVRQNIKSNLSAIGKNQWIAVDGLKKVKDYSFPILPPAHCLVAQVALQVDSRIYVDQNLYKILAPTSRLALYYHEYLIYLYRKKNGFEVRIPELHLYYI